MPKGMFGPGFPPGINLLGSRVLILGFEFLPRFLKRHTDDAATLLRRGTLPIMHTTPANLSMGDLIKPLAALFIRPIVPEAIPLGTPVTVPLFIVPEMALTKGPFFLVKGLPLRGNHHLNPLLVNPLQLLRIGIPRIRASYLTGLR